MTESDPLAFTPVPTSARHDGWTPDRQRAFIEQLTRCGVVSASAKAVGMSAKSAYALRKRPGAEGFAAAWDRAADEGTCRACDTAIDRALNGTARPIFYRGRQVGERRIYSDALLIAALRNLTSRGTPPGSRG